MFKIFEDELSALKTNSAYRQIKNMPECCINLNSNDYLGIAADEDFKRNFLKEYTGKLSNPSSRLLSNDKVYDELEKTLQKKLGLESVLLFNSGYHANIGIYGTFAKDGDVVFCDRLNHASIIDGIKLGGAKLIPFKHLNYGDLREKLKKYRSKYKKAIISSETLFSMDGDFADVEKLKELKKEFDCLLFIDEAHSFGIIAQQYEGIDLTMGTFGKAIGSYGAFCAGNAVLIDYLTNFARPFIFSTTFPPISAAFTKYALEQDLSKRAEGLFYLAKSVREELGLCGESYIIPVILGKNEYAQDMSEELIKKGFYTLPIRYPTVTKGTARLRLSLNFGMDEKSLTELARYVKPYVKSYALG